MKPLQSAALLPALALALLVAGCSAAPPTPARSPSALPAAETATAPTVLPGLTPLPTIAAPTAEATSAPAPPPGGEALATLREDAVFLSDSWGGDAQQALSLGALTSLAFHDGRLAYIVDGSILLADLRGGEPRRLSDAPPAFLLGPELAWTEDGEALLTIADREDETAAETGRQLDIGVVTLADGTWRPGLALADCAGATILRAEGARGTVLLVAWGAEPSFEEAERYDLASGQRLASLPMAGQAEVATSPDRRLAATTLFDVASGVTSILVYDLTEDTAPVRYRLALPAGRHAVALTWAPDGRRLSYLLREGRSPIEAPGEGQGIWLWELERAEATRVAEASDPSAGPAAWTPDGRYLLYRQVDAAGAGAYYAMDPAEGTPRRLSLDPASRILGWVE